MKRSGSGLEAHGMVPNDNIISKFWRAIIKNYATIASIHDINGNEVGKVLDFLTPLALVRNVNRIDESKLFIRADYENIFTNIIASTDEMRFILTGKPGIGKSRFLLYAMYKLVREHNVSNVYYTHSQGDVAFIFSKENGVYDLTGMSNHHWGLLLSHVLQDKNTRSIIN